MTVKEFLESGKNAYGKLVTRFEWTLNGYRIEDERGEISFEPFDEVLAYSYDNNHYNNFTVFEPCTFGVTSKRVLQILRENYDIEEIGNENIDNLVWLLEEVGFNFKLPAKPLHIGFKEANLSKSLKSKIEQKHNFIAFQTEEEYFKPLKEAIDGYEVIECHLRSGDKMSWATLDTLEVDFSNELLDDICNALEQEKCIEEIFGFLTLKDYLEYKKGGEYKGDFIGLRSEFFED